MTTEFLVLTVACTVFALFVLFATVVNWVRVRETRYTPAAANFGKSFNFDDVDSRPTVEPAQNPFVPHLNLDGGIEDEEKESDMPVEIQAGPYTRVNRKPYTANTAYTEEESSDLLNSHDEENTPEEVAEVEASATVDTVEEIECTSDESTTHESSEIDESGAEECGAEAASEEIDEGTLVSNQESFLDNTVPFVRPIRQEVTVPSVRKVEEKPLTLLRFCLLTKNGKNTITGPRIQMIVSKYRLSFRNGVYSKAVSGDSRCSLSIVSANKPYRFDQDSIDTYTSNKLFLGMQLEQSPACIKEFSSLMELATGIQHDLGCRLCDEKVNPMTKEKLRAHLDVLRSSYSVASETAELQASAMM